nr:hypothetical protein [uncultured Massilia sp.]
MGSADFRLIKPIQITDAKLVSSSVPEAVVTEYAAGTTYAVGDIRGVTAGTAQDVYQSLQAGNVGQAPGTSPTWWKLLGRVYAAYSSGTTYAKDAIVSDLVNHQLYQSIVASNTGKALADTTGWLPLGATNRWKMFDKAVNSQTTAPSAVTVSITPNELHNTLTLLNVSGASVTVAQSDSGYSRTRSLVSHDVLSWYDFFYQEPLWIGDIVFDDIPPYIGSTLTVTVNSPGNQAAIGCCFVGRSKFIGKTQWGLTAGALSFSGSNTDKFGNVTLVKRDNAKKMNFDVAIPRGYEDEVYRFMRSAMDTEMVAIASTNWAMTISYGYLGQWEVPLSIDGKTMPVEWRGLVG